MNYPEQSSDSSDDDGATRRSATNLPLPSPRLVSSVQPPMPASARLVPRQTAVHPLPETPLPSSVTSGPAAEGSTPLRSSSLSESTSFSVAGQCVPALGAVQPSSCARSTSTGPQAGLPRDDSGSLSVFTPECRICLASEPPGDLVAPCRCTGSLAYAHLVCLRTWVMEKRSVRCELCGAMYKEPYGSELAASIPPVQPQPHLATVRRITTVDGQPIIIMPVGVDLGPGAIGPFLQHRIPTSTTTIRAGGGGGGGGATTATVVTDTGMETQPLCDWRSVWSYALILVLLLCAVIYVTVISKKRQPEAWLMTLWRVLLVVLPIYLVLRIAFDLYRHRLAQQLAAANLQAVALANVAADAAAAAGHNPSLGSAFPPQHVHAHAHAHGGEVIITRAGNRLLVLQRAVP